MRATGFIHSGGVGAYVSSPANELTGDQSQRSIGAPANAHVDLFLDPYTANIKLAAHYWPSETGTSGFGSGHWCSSQSTSMVSSLSVNWSAKAGMALWPA